MKGFALYVKGVDFFIHTDYKRKTDLLASKIIRKLVNHGFEIPDSPAIRQDILHNLRKATAEIIPLSNGNLIKISGDNFGISDFADSGKTVIIDLMNGGEKNA